MSIRRFRVTVVGVIATGLMASTGAVVEAAAPEAPEARTTVGADALDEVTAADLGDLPDDLPPQIYETLESFGLGGDGESRGERRLPPSIADGGPSGPGALIVGGEPIDITQAPWQVALVDYDPEYWNSWWTENFPARPVKDYLQFCGGSIYSAQVIITAAHCVEDPSTREFVRVATGQTYIYGEDDSGLPETAFIDVTGVIVHPGYVPATYENDIALLILAEPIVWGVPEPIALPTQSASTWPAVDTPAWVTGWGTTQYGAFEIINQLRGVTASVSASPLDPVCGEYGSDYYPDLMLCAGLPEGGADACQGDSGGPLAIDDGGTWYLAGITSWGIGCGLPAYPGVYTRVTTYVGWIEEQCDPSAVPFGGGAGTSGDPWLICSVTHLDNVRTDLDGHFRQVVDIDLNLGTASSSGADPGWEPIGTDAAPFTGVYDGNLSLIGDLMIDRPETDDIGLFGVTNGASITNLVVVGADVTGRDHVGVVVGRAEGTFLSLVGAGFLEVSGRNDVGATVGRIVDSAVDRLIALLGIVTASSVRVGGIVGSLSAEGAAAGANGLQGALLNVSGASSVGIAIGEAVALGDNELALSELIAVASLDAIGDGAVAAAEVGAQVSDATVGGLIGSVGVAPDASMSVIEAWTDVPVGGEGVAGGAFGEIVAAGQLTIAEVSASGAVVGNPAAGGLIGRISGDISLADVSATGTVTGVGSVGGLIGDIGIEVGTGSVDAADTTGVTIARALAAGEVTGTGFLGGFIGTNDAEPLTVSASFWNRTANPSLPALGSPARIVPGLAARSDAALRQFSTFDAAGWSIVEVEAGPVAAVNGYVWGICSGQTYPGLFYFWFFDCEPPVPPPPPPPVPQPPRPVLPTLPVVPAPPAPPTGGAFVGVTPTRVLDTRPGVAGGGSVTRVPLAGRAPTGATGVALNVTVVGASAAGYATVAPCDADASGVSNVNFGAGQTTANAVITGLGASGELCVFVSSSTAVVLDVTGWFVGGFTPVGPSRALDTRTVGAAAVTASSVAAGSVTRVALAGIPATAAGVAVNVAAVEPQSAGYLTVFDCSVRPNTSSVNFAAGSSAAGLAVTGLSTAGEICVYSSSATHLLVDVFGWFDAVFVPVEPERLLDTRTTGPVASGSITRVQVADRGRIPTTARAIAANLTVVDPSADGYATVYPCDASPPNASNLNFVRGETVANSASVALDRSGAVCILSSAPGNYLLDITGWYVTRAS